MGTETRYGIIKSKMEFPIRNLLVVPHGDKDLAVSYPAFGPGYFKGNIQEMQKSYSHPVTEERISFREPTTSESISVAAYDFGNIAKPQIFDPIWFQLGYIVKTSEGVFANPPKDPQGRPITDEQTLKSFLNKAEKVNGIWLYNREDARDFGFAPYETFKQGVQDCDSFAEGGLARLLEHKEKTAESLKEIASPKFYKRGVDVFGFDSVKKPVLRIADLGSSRDFDSGRLDVYVDDWEGYMSGFAFGVTGTSTATG